jgi:hypothetical protein
MINPPNGKSVLVTILAFLNITNYTKMVQTATIAKRGIKKAVVNYVNMSSGAPHPPPPSKWQSISSSFESFGRRNASENWASYSLLSVASVEDSIQDLVDWVWVYVSGVASQATMLEIALQRLQGAKGLKQATISQGNLLKQECTHSNQEMLKLEQTPPT